MKKLTIADYIERYEKTSKAEKTALVFHLEKRVYMALIDSVKGLPIQVCDRIDEQGRAYQTLRLNLKQRDCLRLRDKGAALLGTVTEFFADKLDEENNGEYVERKVIERYHGRASEKGIAYYKAGDAEIAGMQVQIKFENGTLARLDTIQKAWQAFKKVGA